MIRYFFSVLNFHQLSLASFAGALCTTEDPVPSGAARIGGASEVETKHRPLKSRVSQTQGVSAGR
jgi:hypothetical protein